MTEAIKSFYSQCKHMVEFCEEEACKANNEGDKRHYQGMVFGYKQAIKILEENIEFYGTDDIEKIHQKVS